MEMQKQLWNDLLGMLEQDLVVLPDKPEETPESTLRALWWTTYGRPLSVVAAAQADDLPNLSTEQKAELRNLLSLRLSGTPLAHLTGRQHFMGLDLLASPDALVPRKETELLGKTALELLQNMATEKSDLVYIDVCTGGGNLPVALATQVSNVMVHASDISNKAIHLAQKNIEFFGLETRVVLHEGDLLAPFDSADFHQKVDLLTCNPPYISSAKVAEMQREISEHEPSAAFDGGPFGITILQRLIGEAPKYLKPNGWLAFEVGLGQGNLMLKRMTKKYAYNCVQPVVDDKGDIRVILAQHGS